MLVFDNTAGSEITITDAPKLHLPLPVSMSTLVRFNDTAAHRGILSLDDWDDGSNNRYGVILWRDSADKVATGFGDGSTTGSSSRRTFVSTATVTSGVWYHIVSVIRATDDMEVYVDGAFWPGTIGGTGDPNPVYSTNPGTIGATDNTFNGDISHIMVWDRALSAADARLLARDPFGWVTPAPSLLAPIISKHIATGRKPGRWMPNPADIDPQFLNYWRDLKWIVPLWQNENPGKGVSVIAPSGAAQIASTATWTVGSGRYGHWVDGVNCSGDSDLVLGPLPERLRFSGAQDLTVLLMFKFNNASGFTPFLGQDSASSAGRLEIYLNGSDQLIGQVVNGGTSGLGTPTITFIDGEDYIVTVTRRDGGGEWFAYVNGVLEAPEVGGGSQTVDVTLPLGVMGSPGTSWVGAESGRGYFAAAWDRDLSHEEHLALHRDPFGFITPYPQLFGLSVELFATATGTITAVVDEIDTTTDIHLSVDDDPASPSDGDWMNNSIDPGQIFLGLTDMPAGFGTAESASIDVRYRGQVWQEGSLKLFVQLFQSNESTSLSDEVEVATVSGAGSFANTNVTITGVSTSASKAVWDAAVVRFRWGVS
jgi:hypothetical protein